MTVAELTGHTDFALINEHGLDKEIACVYTCDLLSVVMGRAPQGCAWVTVMGNVNSVAVAVLTDMACIVLAEGMEPDAAMQKRASEQEVALIRTRLPVFEAALAIHNLCHA